MALKGPELVSVAFEMFTSEEVRELSVVEVKTPLCFNALGHPLKDGPYDLLMGPCGFMADPCGTCRQPVRNCPGHFGHVELPLPVVNPLFHKALYTVLRMACSACSRVLLPAQAKILLVGQLHLLDLGLAVGAQELVTKFSDLTKGNVPEEVLETLVAEEMTKHVPAEGQAQHQPPTKIVEDLRQQFIAHALRQFAHVKSCPYCKAPFKKVTSFQNKLLTTISKVEIAGKFKETSDNAKSRNETKLIIPEESRRMLRGVWERDSALLKVLFPVLRKTKLEHPTDLFFLDVVLVPPPKVRPVNYVNGQMVENSQTRAYKSILNGCVLIKNIVKAVREESFEGLSEECRALVAAIKGDTPIEKLHQSWLELQSDVDHLLDADMNKLTSGVSIAGLKQVVEKKQGILRMHMMGKRVNFAARTVITPDPNLQIEEIGIPEYFAMRLSYPVRVNAFNVDDLRRLVRNGPDVYPGATIVESENGSQVKLLGGRENKTKRDAIAKLLLKTERPGGKIVHRHLVNGDMLLLNRQPTLHRPSIMAHRARVLKSEKTLRMHYSNCKAYNADFDGDEMNVHCPQGEVARSEASSIVNVSNQYLVPKDGTPLGGLIQDHVVSGVRLTVRGQLFTREDYHQLVYQALSHDTGTIRLLPPCIVKPRAMWSGKQIISTILINIIPEGKERISLAAAAKIGLKSWEKAPPRAWLCGTPFPDPKTMSEAEVIIRKGELLSGVLDKQHYGATQFGLTHCLYELYGGRTSSKFLDSLGRLFTYYLQWRGFTIGVEDILVLRKPDKKRSRIVRNARKVGDMAATKALDLEDPPDDLRERLQEAYFKEGMKFRARLDQEYKKALDGYTNNINKVCLPGGLLMKFPENNLQLMVTSGAKGSTVNTMQISCLLGQIELEGKRPPFMISGRTLPSFLPFETSPRAGGFIDGRFMTGINPQEFFFHCMAGREGLIDTAVKTSRSGYLQRCLIKHLEGVTVAYDNTVRDHDGSVIQFAYGEDGLDVTRSKFLHQQHMNFLYNNRDTIIDKTVVAALKEDDNAKDIKEYKKKLYAWLLTHGTAKPKQAFTRFSECVRETVPEKYFTKRKKGTGRFKSYEKILEMWNGCEERESYACEKLSDPVTSVYRANRDFGVITEKIEELISEYLQEKFEADLTKKEMRSMKKSVTNMMSVKFMTSLCEPGEPVGLLAAQSIGEPSTQMTLNTFHFAGRGEMNVTLGIPRLREILMTASKEIKTPNMDIPLLKTIAKPQKKADMLRRTFRRVTVADVLENITVNERLQMKPDRSFTYTIRFQFLPRKCYKTEFTVSPAAVLRHMEKKFLIKLSVEIRKLGKMYGDVIHVSREERNAVRAEEGEDDPEEGRDAGGGGVEEAHESSDEENEMDDDDATKARLRGKHQEGQEYDEEDSEKEATDEESELNTDEKADDEEKEEDDVKMTKEELATMESRHRAVLTTFSIVKSYRYDVAGEEWCEMVIGVPLTLSKIDFSSLLRDICERSVVYEIPNVKRAIVVNNGQGDLAVKTEGINIVEMFKYNRVLDLNRLYSNDVHKIAKTYGIEAAGRVVVRELQNVFGVYGITVDPRHLLLIADYMTHQGVFLPLNRAGMADSPSPLQQMSFESSIGFLRNAVFQGKVDSLQSPSSRIMIGRGCFSGTGCFELFGAVSSTS